MAFRKKCQFVDITNIDVMIVQECEAPERFDKVDHGLNYNQFLWCGDNIHKGVGVFVFGDYHVEIRKDYNKEFRYIIPIVVTGPNTKYNLYAIWAMPHPTNRRLSYVGQILAALNYYNDLNSENMILIGDFNSNAIWNGVKKYGNHADLIHRLNEDDIFSIYHRLFNEEHGEESIPTQYMYKHLDKPYHLDYCCMSDSLFLDDLSFDIGSYKDWKAYSDHMPITIRGIGD